MRYIAFLGVCFAACTGGVGSTVLDLTEDPAVDLDPEPSIPTTNPPPQEDTGADYYEGYYDSLSSDAARRYLVRMAPLLARRPLTQEERDLVQMEGGGAVQRVIRTWVEGDAAPKTAAWFISEQLSTSGQANGINYDLPAQLAAFVAEQDLPWSEVLTAESCRDSEGQPIECDTGAPYTAGLLTTRAFMAARASRFNLTRASTLMGAFACRDYPMERELQPFLERNSLIQMFGAESLDEIEDERAANGFGNGFACYSCHGQFGAHAQVFVKYDEQGRWIQSADGIQDPDGELGRSTGGLMASHMADPQMARSEATQFFGVAVENLAGAAQRLAQSDVFLPCTIKQLLVRVLNLDPAVELDSDRLSFISEEAKKISPNPTFRSLLLAAFTDPWVVANVLGSEEEE